MLVQQDVLGLSSGKRFATTPITVARTGLSPQDDRRVAGQVRRAERGEERLVHHERGGEAVDVGRREPRALRGLDAAHDAVVDVDHPRLDGAAPVGNRTVSWLNVSRLEYSIR